ncbi:penicillin acylase family protein [Actinopolymorpha singaporensis]|uniref:Penicillin amidase n=1 Tax=Actinopolymorpha singaporensis TaxID=117157 RepID=A0A1H1L7M5_9ACTN|nr:penicillin acylase family protein [Actinopolymorpha singaporensis]SDR69879.1 penicillin amidase [Actinopolymorpha singaporensis]
MQRRLVRLAVALATLLALVLVAGSAAVIVAVRRSLPGYDGEARLPGLSAAVEVRRDAQGVPQIYADTPEDLFQAQGYVQAQDRFYEMDFRRHLTAGRLAEWFGPRLVSTDRFVRTMGWRRVAAQEYPQLPTSVRGYLLAFTDGVNAYLDTHSGSRLSVEYTLGLLGPEQRPEPWSPVDSLAWLKAMAWDLRGNLDDEIARALDSARVAPKRVDQLYPAYPFDRHPPIVTRLPTADSAGESGPVPGAGSARMPGRVAGVPLESDTPAPDSPSAAADLPADLTAGRNSDLRADLPADSARALREARAFLAAAPSSLGVGDGANAGIGSNSWVVAGSHTATGKPMLANDPHLAPQMPSLWYQIGLHCRVVGQDCPFDVAGFGFSGMPGVVIGHNDRIAWGLTNLGADVTDLYVERIDGDSYLYDGAREPLTTRRETIKVRGRHPVELIVRSTRHGPLLSDANSSVGRAIGGSRVGRWSRAGGWQTAVALRWTALEPGRAAEALFGIDAARDWQSFRAAAELFDSPAQNLVYADVDGHIGYQAPGRIPIRKGSDGRWPVPGWSSDYDWTGWVPFDRLPAEFDPPRGYIVTANQAVAPASYPFQLADHWSYGYRSDRIGDLIAELIRRKGRLGVADMQAIQTDTRNEAAAMLVPYLLRIRVDAFTAQAQRLFRGWNYSQGADSAPAAYFNAVWARLLGHTFHDELPRTAWPSGGDRWWEVVRGLLREPNSQWWDDVRTKGVREDRDDILRRALEGARRDLTRRLAKDPAEWRWGRLHRLELVDQSFGRSGVAPLERLFNRGPYDLPGGTDAVLATAWNAATGFDVRAVPSMRMVVDLADFDRSRWVNLTGISGHPGSGHYNDQFPTWEAGGTFAWPYAKPAVERAAAHLQALVP